ncbi:MAG TPA: ATP-binding protein [Candidatus Saccharimonadales bacterium]|nr:ATP-binding protein [Candidatus Saccharimonadales bacterium]
MNIEIALLVPTAIANVILGMLVLVRGLNRTSSRYFAISALWVSAWSVGDLILLSAQDEVWVRFGSILFYIAPILTTLFLVYFSRTFPNNNKIPLPELFALAGVAVGLSAMVIARPDFFTQTITMVANGPNLLVVNPIGYSIYALYFFAYFSLSYLNLYRSLKKSTGARRNQIRYSFFGIFLSSFLAALSNLVLPVVATAAFIWLGPLLTALYVTTTTFAIVKHRLFDIRLIVARSIAYLLLLATLSILYATALFAFTSIFFPQAGIFGAKEGFYVLMAVFLSFTFQPFKRFFDRFTNRIFYRDAYDSQQVLDSLSAVLVSSNSVKVLADRSLKIINSAIQPSFEHLILIKKGDGFDRQFKIGRSNNAIDCVVQSFEEMAGQSILVQDDIREQHGSLAKIMSDAGVAIIAKLRTSEETVGYLLLGYKASGNIVSDQDLALLRIATDELAVALQNALRFEEISRFNETLKKEVADATAQLRETNRKLKKLDEIKDEFISMASHQLRTPLTSVKGYISMVLEGDAGPVAPQQKQLLDEAFTSAQRMVYLIGDFLNVSRLQSGKFVIEWKPTNLAIVVKEEVDQLRETAARHHIKLQYQAPSSFPTLMLDENKMRQVVMNFADNAIFYTRPGGTVKMVLLATATEVRFEVQDNGIGVSATEQHKLFTKFFRAENARKVRPDGTGIGLFMAKKVVAAHGGSIIFESQEGKGSTFGFTLPQPSKKRR